MKPGGNRLRIAALIVLGAAYALAAHWFTTRPGLAEYGAILSVAPWLAAGVALAWQSPQRATALALGVAALVALYFGRGWLVTHFAWVYFIQHAGTFLALGVGFGRTLAAGREPICSRFARSVHGRLGEALARYTRQVTVAWTAFFAVMCLTSALLFALAPIAAWSVFANLLTPLLIAAMFGIEYLVRLRLLPEVEHRGVFEAVRAFWAPAPAPIDAADAREPR